MKWMTAIRACAALLGIAAMAITGPAFGQSVEDFYHGKILTIVVSADAGPQDDHQPAVDGGVHDRQRVRGPDRMDAPPPGA
ncbi:hypothetical protein SB860_37230, partial [Burkholderia sp. SIMBA_019]